MVVQQRTSVSYTKVLHRIRSSVMVLNKTDQGQTKWLVHIVSHTTIVNVITRDIRSIRLERDEHVGRCHSVLVSNLRYHFVRQQWRKVGT